MIVPLKIIVCSLKSVKWLPGFQNDSLVMNTPGSLDSPVVNTPRGLTPRWWIHRGVLTPLWWIHWESTSWCIWNNHQNRFTKVLYGNKLARESILDSMLYSSLGSRDSPVTNTQGSHDSLVMNTPGSLNFPVVNTLGSRLRILITPGKFEKIWNPF
jgi:hypothetical protein